MDMMSLEVDEAHCMVHRGLFLVNTTSLVVDTVLTEADMGSFEDMLQSREQSSVFRDFLRLPIRHNGQGNDVGRLLDNRWNGTRSSRRKKRRGQ